jgi:hypothetical protein
MRRGAVLLLIAAGPMAAVTPALPGGEKAGPKAAPFVEVGPTVGLRSGTQPIPGHCTTLSGYGMRELRVGLVVVRGGEETAVEERKYEWDRWPTKPAPQDREAAAPVGLRVQGVVQVQFLDAGKGQFHVAFGAGVEDAAGSDYVRKPREVTVPGTPGQFSYRQGRKAPDATHLVRIDVIYGGDKPIELGEVKSVEELKRASKDKPRTTYLVTTLRWSAAK